MKIAIAASEAAPFAKTGGLADVVGALPKALEDLGCEVRVFLPKYDNIDESKYDIHYEYAIGEMPVRIGGVPWSVHVQRTLIPGSTVPLYLIDCPHYFHRGRIYTSDADEHARFALFSKAVIEALQYMQWAPDVLHVNDWQTALIPLLMKENYSWDSMFGETGSLLTIHNIGYQGLFGTEALGAAEIRSDLFYRGGPLEKDGGVSFLKAGIMYSELINTVSDTYAREILSPEFGAGLETVLRMRAGDLSGVLNGIDTDVWNPESDPHLPHHFSAGDRTGREKNKRFLMDRVGLPWRDGVPLIGIISRLVEHKGFDLIAEALAPLMGLNAQWVILGSGEERFEGMFRAMHHRRPESVWTYIGFNNELAHLIEASADIFLMPSRSEPCGLNQMYSLRYGAVPVVRKTGGLADTVWDWHDLLTAGRRDGNGFSFADPTPFALASTVDRAVTTFADKETWNTIQSNGMKADFSWTRSAGRYLDLYRRAAAKRSGRNG